MLPRFLLLGLLIGACFPLSAWSSDDVPLVRSTEPAEGAIRAELQEEWRAGGESDEVFFGVISDAVADDQGNTYLLDAQLAEVQVYGPDGGHLRTLGREGDGPGEFRRPSDLLLLSEGRVGVAGGMPGRIVVLQQDGTPGVSIRPGDAEAGGFSFFFNAIGRGDDVVLLGQSMSPDGESGMKRTRYLSRVDGEGTELARYWEQQGQRDFSNPKYIESEEYIPSDCIALDSGGRLFAAMNRDRYAISVFNPDGSLERIIERANYSQRIRTAEEKANVTSGMMIMVNGRRLEMESEVEDTEAAIERLWIDNQDRLWVVHSHSDNQDGVFRSYDLFDTSGAWLQTVNVVVDGDPDNDGILLLDGDRFLLIKGIQGAADAMNAGFGGHNDESDGQDDADEASPLEVISYRLAS